MRTVVGRVYRFRASHSLPDFDEPWCYPHVHDYTVYAEARGGTPTDLLDDRWEEMGPWDGGTLSPRFDPSTVENVAETLLYQFPVEVLVVIVWEDRARYGRAER